MTQEPRTLAGDLQALREAARYALGVLLDDLKAHGALYAWSLILAAVLAGLLGAWFGLIDPPTTHSGE